MTELQRLTINLITDVGSDHIFQRESVKFGITDKQEIAALWGNLAYESNFLQSTKDSCANSNSCPLAK